ncbi:MAG: metalloregulator ArsR/SmtB family transcription factor [Anderseniella sp.]|jgi:DNA-binding transcriptional ArsR family regulator|nr:metalloregulator ArsR/SmtB family transcription factor [Anderseniella sp.]
MRHLALAANQFIVYRRFTMNDVSQSILQLSAGSPDRRAGQFSQATDAATAVVLAALSHPARLAIVRRLSASDACCCKDVVRHLDLAQSTVSQHLKVLVQAGLVNYEPNRRRSRYILDRSALQNALAAVGGLVNECCPGGACQPEAS